MKCNKVIKNDNLTNFDMALTFYCVHIQNTLMMELKRDNCDSFFPHRSAIQLFVELFICCHNRD